MPAQFTDKPVVGKILPLQNGTRLRADSSTFTKVNGTFSKGDLVEIDLVREYKSTDLSEYHMQGDKWGRVVKINGFAFSGWMAIVYLGADICSADYVFVGNPDPEPDPEPVDPAKIVSAVITINYDGGATSTHNLIPE